MEPTTWAGIAAVIVAASTFIAVVIGAIAQYKVMTRVKSRIDVADCKIDVAHEKIDEVHTIVNQQRTDMLDVIAYQKRIIERLEKEKEDDESRS